MLFVEVQPDRGNLFTFPCLFAPNEIHVLNETQCALNETCILNKTQFVPNETRILNEIQFVPNETQFAPNEIQFSPNFLPTHRRDAHRNFFFNDPFLK